jgi:hypothetical protein
VRVGAAVGLALSVAEGVAVAVGVNVAVGGGTVGEGRAARAGAANATGGLGVAVTGVGVERPSQATRRSPNRKVLKRKKAVVGCIGQAGRVGL